MGIESLTQSSHKTLEIFFKNPEKEHYVREAARKSNLPVKTVSWNLIKLAKLKILTREKKGKEVWYSLNHENELTRKLSDMYETVNTKKFLEKNPDLRMGLSEFLNSLNLSLGDPILFIVLFGSYAKGYATKRSDVDILVVVREGEKKDYVEWKKMVDKIAGDIHSMYGLELSTSFMTLRDFRENLNKKEPFIIGILNDHYVLYGSELYTKEVFSWLISKK